MRSEEQEEKPYRNMKSQTETLRGQSEDMRKIL